MIYHFEHIVFDSENFNLMRNGEAIAIEPQVFDLLNYLIQQRQRLVTRQELLDELWKGKVVSDATLSNHIKMARAALGDDGEQQKLIKTLRGRGYQFIAEVHHSKKHEAKPLQSRTRNTTINEQSAHQQHSPSRSPTHITTPPSSRKSKKGKLITAIFLAVFVGVIAGTFALYNKGQVTKPSRSIAILPFQNHSNLDKDEYFTAGVHHDLLMQVAKIRGIKTISRTSVSRYRNSQKSIQSIADELGVAVILEGGVQRSGKEIRINVQLINGENDESLWAESYTRALTAENVFAIQSEIARAVAKALSTVLSPAEQIAIAAPPTHNLSALDAYFLAGAAMRKNSNAGFAQAIQHLHRALTLDPSFALVYAVLAQLYLDQIYWAGMPVAQQLSLASPLVQRALELNPELSEAHRALASLQEHQGQYSAAQHSYLQALEYRPNNEQVYAALGRFQLWVQRDINNSLGNFYKAFKLNPKDNGLKENLTEALIRDARFVDARTMIDEILLETPHYSSAYRALADIEAWQNKDLAKAQSHLRHALNLDPKVPSYALKLALRFLDLGEQKLASLWLHYSLDIAPNNNTAAFTRALIHELEGEMDAAFNAYLTVPINSPMLGQSLYPLLKIGLQLQRKTEVKTRFKNVYPQLFLAQPKVNARNYVGAYLLGRFLNTSHQEPQPNTLANALLEQSLTFALKQPVGDWQGQHHNWLTQIYISLGQHDQALFSFQQWIAAGHYSAQTLQDPIYLKQKPPFQQATRIMEQATQDAKQALKPTLDQQAYWGPHY